MPTHAYCHACPSTLQDPYFHPLLGSLVKLVFLSSALHQLTVVACSSMPYAVGAQPYGDRRGLPRWLARFALTGSGVGILHSPLLL